MVTLPKNALQRVQIGQSFAEYDLLREDPTIFVATPASLVATQPENKKCFFCRQARQRKNRDYIPSAREESKIRDWIASNRAASGFWELVRSKYGATQVMWECKNYDRLHADDFHQAGYYMNDTSGRFIVIAFRGTEVEESYFRHIDRLAKDRHGLVLLLTEKDLRVFIRQALNGKFKEDHISELFDRTVRAVS